MLKIHKVIGSLPGTLEADSIYLVRVGTGVDLYVTDSTGAIAYTLNLGPTIYVQSTAPTGSIEAGSLWFKV